MIKVTTQQLWQFLTINLAEISDSTYADYVLELDEDQPAEFAITEAQFIALRDAQFDGELRRIVADSEISEHRWGGDEICSIADEVAETIENGHTIVTWYGPKAECLVASYDKDTIQVIE